MFKHKDDNITRFKLFDNHIKYKDIGECETHWTSDERRRLEMQDSTNKSIYFQEKELYKHLIWLKNQSVSGTIQIDAKISKGKVRSRILIFRKGQIIYGGVIAPKLKELARKIGNKYKPHLINIALSVAEQKMQDKCSFRELFELLVRMRALTWQEIENFIHHQVVLTLEQLFLYPGKFSIDPEMPMDLSFGNNNHGIGVEKVIRSLRARQSEWQSFQDYIPSMDAIPLLTDNAIDNINDNSIKKHLEKYVNGKNSLVDIAAKIQKDPLQIARSYLSWAQIDWVKFKPIQKQLSPFRNLKSTPSVISPPRKINNNHLLTVLTIDDSTTVQSLIKLALGDRYNVLVASNAVEGFKILNRKQVDLLLLDVNMPGIDGLKMCKTLRSQEKFKQLPIIMLTAKDSRVDKLKGQIAGSTQYLHKPFANKELCQVIDYYLKPEKKPFLAKAG